MEFPQGNFTFQGPRGQTIAGGLTLAHEHDPGCRFATTDMPLPAFDLGPEDASLRRRLRDLCRIHASSSGCNCPVDIPPSPALAALLRTASAPRQAMPVTLRATQSWPDTLPSQDEPSQRMADVDYGTLTTSRHASASPANTQLPPPGWIPRPNAYNRHPTVPPRALKLHRCSSL